MSLRSVIPFLKLFTPLRSLFGVAIARIGDLSGHARMHHELRSQRWDPFVEKCKGFALQLKQVVPGFDPEDSVVG